MAKQVQTCGKRPLSFSVILICLAGCLCAQPWSGIIAPGRAIDWSNVGIPGGIPNRTSICQTFNPGATGAQISAALQSAACANKVVFLNAGTYKLSQAIDFGPGVSNRTLRGAGADQTKLVFTGGAANCLGYSANICMAGADVNWPGGPENTGTWKATSYARGQTQITMSTVANLQVGSPLILDQCNDGLAGAACTGTEVDPGTIFVCDSTASQCNDDGPDGGASSGQRNGRDQEQVVTVTAINGNVVTFTPGLYMPNWRASQNPGAWWPSVPIANDGVENLSSDSTAGNEQSGLTIFDCVGCWVKGIRSINTSREHVWIAQSPRTVVRDSYFYGTKNAASQSYGVECYPSSDSLIENNIFQHVTTPQMINAACSGTVVAYNYSIDDYYTPSPGWMMPSTMLHAGGIDNILYEGNIGGGFRADLFHGSHHFATIFRNFYLGSEATKIDDLTPMFLDPYSRYFNLVGNVLGTTSQQTSYQATPGTNIGSGQPVYILGTGTVTFALAGDPLTVSTLMRWGNYDVINNAVRFVSSEVPSGLSQYANPVPTSQALPASFYLSAKPGWFGAAPWPAIGPDVVGGSMSGGGGHANKIPAQLCYSSSPTDSSYGGNVLQFSANTCYPQGTSTGQLPAPPATLSAVAH